MRHGQVPCAQGTNTRHHPDSVSFSLLIDCSSPHRRPLACILWPAYCCPCLVDGATWCSHSDERIKKSSTNTAPNGRMPPISTDTAGCMYLAVCRARPVTVGAAQKPSSEHSSLAQQPGKHSLQVQRSSPAQPMNGRIPIVIISMQKWGLGTPTGRQTCLCVDRHVRIWTSTGMLANMFCDIM